jgi:protein phosphatase PTC7
MPISSRVAHWAAEPEIDPTMDNEDEQIEGQEMTPYECLNLAYSDVLEDEQVEAGELSAQ